MARGFRGLAASWAACLPGSLATGMAWCGWQPALLSSLLGAPDRPASARASRRAHRGRLASALNRPDPCYPAPATVAWPWLILRPTAAMGVALVGLLRGPAAADQSRWADRPVFHRRTCRRVALLLLNERRSGLAVLPRLLLRLLDAIFASRPRALGLAWGWRWAWPLAWPGTVWQFCLRAVISALVMCGRPGTSRGPHSFCGEPHSGGPIELLAEVLEAAGPWLPLWPSGWPPGRQRREQGRSLSLG